MGILFLITFIFLRIENSNAENSLTVITLKNSGIIDISNNESVTATTIPNTTTITTTINNSSITSDDVIMQKENVENLDSVTMSAALVRARREPPITIIRHRARVVSRRPKPRRRYKKPKIRYGPPPNFNFGEPLSYYKPEAEIHDDEIYDIQSFKNEFGSDFNIQSFELSDYDKQPIEIDFYGRGGSGRSGGSRKRKPTIWSNDSKNFKSSYTSPHEQSYQEPSGEYWKEFAESPSIIPPKPSNAYGIPPETSYIPLQSNYAPPPSQNDYAPPPPQESYQLPAQDIYQPFSQDTYNLPTQNTYKPPPPDIYQPLPHENYDPERHKFAEPPANTQWNSQSSFDNKPIPEYTSSTELNGGEFNGPKYLPPPDNGGKNFPKTNKNGNFAEPPTYYNKYRVPGTLPLDESHKSPSYDYPKSSYEVPIYNSIPFNSNDATPTQQILYPPNDLYRPDYSPPKFLKESSNKVEITEVRNLTNYNNKNIIPQPFSTSLEELLDPPTDYLENISTTSQSRNRRKHKRIRDSNKNKKQHILDTDELRQAFGSSSRIDNQYNTDSSSEYQKIRSNTKKRAPENFVLISSVNDGKSAENLQNWEPIKLRDNDKIKNQPNIEISNSNLGINNNKNKIANSRQIRLERTTDNTFKDIQVISIEKSHSHSFYAGTMSPHELMTYTGINSRADNGAVYVSSRINVANNSENNDEKRKGFVFDEEILPKNHKYF